MIFSHHFVFQDEPALQQKHSHVPSSSLCYQNNETIQVVESFEYAYLDVFHSKSDWFAISGQEGRYCASTPFEETDEDLPWALDIKDVLTLIWDAEDQKIVYIKGKNYTPERLRFWIYHTFFPLVLELKQKYSILHVGSVEIAGKPVLFSAFSFGGKSTLTDYFIRQGHTMLSDDTIAIAKHEDTYCAIASYPFHRPHREVETLGYPVVNFATEPKPLHAIYILEKSEPGALVEIVEIKGIEKFKAFYNSSFIDFNFMKQRRFVFFTEMAKHIPAYKVKVPWDIKRLGEVYHAICSNEC